MTITPEIERDLMVQYRRTRSPFKAARAVGISTDEAWSIVDKFKDDHFEERNGGRGRHALEPFIVATRRASTREWENESQPILTARRQHEAGTHIICTGRDGGWLILYAIPRRRGKQPRPNYFTTESF